MEGYSSSDSNISLDSLEKEFNKKTTMKKKVSEEGIDTILVPFYEKDVLMKVPKTQKSKNIYDTSKVKNISNRFKKESTPVKNYLVNKEAQKKKHTSYLEMFRKQFAPSHPDNRPPESDIRSISPEFGDTERESFREEVSNPATDFYNTEAYNEIYYDKIMNQEINHFLEEAYAGQLKFNNDIRPNSPDVDDNNLRSISDVSQPRRNMRRATLQPIPSIKLGGLGPDMENIRPRLERARSLQRYSEKVRMENRVKIYKKSVQEEIDKKEKDLNLKRQESVKSKEPKRNETSFLVNKNGPDNPSPINRRIHYPKSKSANIRQGKRVDIVNDKITANINYHIKNVEKNKNIKKSVTPKVEAFHKERIRSSGTKRSNIEPVMDQGRPEVPVPPVQISFLVNMGGLRPSSALRTLEAKHRMYQEKVKQFDINNNNGIDSDNK